MLRSVFQFGHMRSALEALSMVGGVRNYHVNDNSVLWYRRRRKALEQRLKVINPSTPVIDQHTPLPLTNEGRYPPHLFPDQEQRNLEKEEGERKGIVAEINRQLRQKESRLFAVIHVKGKQFKVTPEDIIILQGYWAPNIGDRLRLHKVMLCGGTDFTLIGKPLLDPGLIRVEGTVVEKTLSYTKLHFRLKKRKNFRRLKFMKEPYTMLRINMVELAEPLKALQEIPEKEEETVEGSYTRIAATP